MKSARNTTTSNIFIKDIGITLLVSTTYVIPPQDYDLWANSTLIDAYINNGQIVINDGYDDLKPALGLKHIHEEGLVRGSAFIASPVIQTLSNSTFTLTKDSKLLYIFTGSTSGQIIKLPDATTLQTGYKFEFWNAGSQSAIIQNGNSSSIFLLAGFQKTWVLLQDNSTVGGTWIIEANFTGGTGAGNGTLVFGFDGTASTGRWLETSTNIASSYTGYIMAGAKNIRALSIGGATGSNYTGIVTLYKNGASFDTITLSAARKNSKLNLNHILADKDEITARVTSGSIARPVVIIWL